MSYLARRYANALMDAGVEPSSFQRVTQGILDCPELWEALMNPAIWPGEKIAVLEALPEVSQEPMLLRFFTLLAENRRLRLLPDIKEAFQRLLQESQNVASCVMRCVRIPDADLIERMKRMLCQVQKKEDVTMTFVIDPSLIGGFILTIEGVSYDRSVRGRLQGLSRYLEEVSAT